MFCQLRSSLQITHAVGVAAPQEGVAAHQARVVVGVEVVGVVGLMMVTVVIVGVAVATVTTVTVEIVSVVMVTVGATEEGRVTAPPMWLMRKIFPVWDLLQPLRVSR